MDAELFDGDRLLAKGACVMSSGAPLVTGSIEIGKAPSMLSSRTLSLRLEGGQEMDITPRRIEHSARGPAVLIFEVTP